MPKNENAIQRNENAIQRVEFRLINMECCAYIFCNVNPRFPSYCPQCGKFIYPAVKGWVTFKDDNAILRTTNKATVNCKDNCNEN